MIKKPQKEKHVARSKLSPKILSTQTLETPWTSTRKLYSKIWLRTVRGPSASSAKNFWARKVKVSRRHSFSSWLPTIIATSLNMWTVTYLKKLVKWLSITTKKHTRLNYLPATWSGSALFSTSRYSKARCWITLERLRILRILPWLRHLTKLTSSIKRNSTTPRPSLRCLART